MNKQLSVLTIMILTCVFGLTSCSGIFTGIYGMKKMEKVDEKTILHYSQKYKIPLENSYQLDTTYISYLASLDTTQYKVQVKNHYQPLQALYYNKSGQLLSFQANCYAGGFPNLKWNRNETMTIFPPKQQAPIDSIVPLEIQLKYLLPLSKTESISANDYDYIVVVYWSKFMGRQSKRLIRFTQRNSTLATDKRVKIIYANTDNIFAREQQKSNGNDN